MAGSTVRAWVQTQQGRKQSAELAKRRELLKLALRARCSLDEAQEHRERGERWCDVHGWYRQQRCMPCKTAHKRLAADKRRRLRE